MATEQVEGETELSSQKIKDVIIEVARKKLKYGPFNGGFIGNVKENEPVNGSAIHGPQWTHPI